MTPSTARPRFSEGLESQGDSHRRTRWPAPAKLNLFLRILGRRADGYHRLQSVFQFLDVGDTLRFTDLDAGEIRLSSPLPGVAPEEDLCVRAARCLRHHTDTRRGATITVHKVLPMGAGLGGGSSDAATTLVALNALWGLGLEVDELAEIGLTLGADVPVFVRGEAAWGEGIGEHLIPISLPERWFAVIYPGCTVSTAEIFGANELTRNSPPLTIPRSLLRERSNGDASDAMPGALSSPGCSDNASASVETVLAMAGNDCEAVVRARYPEVTRALEWLSARVRGAKARMTGTGAAVFAVCDSEREARSATADLPDHWWGGAFRTRNRSPLRRAPRHEVAALEGR